MVNAWSLLGAYLDGTLEEECPIMNKDDVTILGGDGKDTVELQPGEAATDNIVSAELPENNHYAAESVSLNLGGGEDYLSFSSDDGFSVVGNPSPLSAGYDTISFRTDGYPGSIEDVNAYVGSRVPGGLGNDHISLDVGAGNTAWNWDPGLAHTHYDDPKYYATKPKPDLKSGSTQKYQEDKGIADLKDYVSSTYQGHYTNDNSDVQTLDLIHSVGDAESFCRSNALKYLSRYDKKGQAKRDILKAMHYCLLLYYFSGNTNDETPTRGYETF